MKTFLIILSLLTSLSLSIAQITITSEDFPPFGSAFGQSETEFVNFNATQTGGPHTWDISGFTYTEIPEQTIVLENPANTPYGSEFPTATHAYHEGSAYTYTQVSASQFVVIGMADAEVDTVIEPDQPIVQFVFPFTMGTQYTSVTSITIQQGPFIFTIKDSTLHNCVGWGTLVTPHGSWPILKVIDHSYSWTVFNGTPEPMEEDWDLNWHGENGFMGCTYNPDNNSDDFTGGELYLRYPTTVDAEPARGPVANSFSVEQNYPNPFNPSTHLPISIDQSGDVSLKIYNETGRLVSEQNYTFGPGQHTLPIDGSKWSSGNYFANVSINGIEQTRKMQLVK
jgi:hypothetical protein